MNIVQCKVFVVLALHDKSGPWPWPWPWPWPRGSCPWLHHCLLRSHKVTGTDTDRAAAYDFLLVFHNNNGLWAYLAQFPI